MRNTTGEFFMMDKQKSNDDLIQEVISLRRQIDDLKKEKAAARKECDILQEKEKFFRLIVSNMTELFRIADLEGNIIFLSSSHEDLLGYEAEERIGQSIFELIHPDDIKKVKEQVAQGITSGESGQGEYRVRRKDGTYLWLETMGKFFVDDNGEIIGVIYSSRDITKRKEMEESIRASENLYRTIFESTGTAMAMIEEDMTISLVNKEFERMTGYLKSEVKGKPWTYYISTKDIDKMKTFHDHRRTQPDQVPESYEFSYIDKRGALRHSLLTAGLIPETDRTVVSVIDTTEKKQFEEALRHSEEKYRVLFENVDQAIFVAQDGMLKFINPRMHDISGYALDDLKEQQFIEFIHPDDRQMVIENHLRRLSGEEISPTYEFRAVNNDGNIFWVELHVVLFDWEGRPATLNFMTDITERKHAEELLKQSERHLQTILQGSPIPSFVIDNNHRITIWNRALEELSGINAHDAIGTTRHWGAFYQEQRSCLADLLVDETVNAIGQWYEGKYQISDLIENAFIVTDFFPHLGNDGRWLRITAVELRTTDGTIFGAIETLEDITDQIRASDAVRESERKYRELVELLPQTVFEINEDENIISMNQHGLRATGYTWEDFHTSVTVSDLVIPEDRERLRNDVVRIMQGEAKDIGFEYTALRKDGKTFPIIAYAAPIITEGNPTGIRGISIDITERKRLESQLLEAQKMEAVGTLAGGIAHDFNNLLMGIQGYASLMLLDVPPDHPHYEKLKNIESQVRSGADLTRQLLGFARGGRYETKPVDLNEIAQKTVTIFGRTKKDIPIRTKFQDVLWTVKADKSQIEQVLLNLYVNAWQAMPAGGDLFVETRNVILEEHDAVTLDIIPGRYVMLSVTDNGVGMDRATMERIFEPFFTTKEMGRGTGLGLASVYGIARGHGGTVTVTSEKHQGSTFYLYLPASEEPPVEKADSEGKIIKGQETLLLVDDEEMIIEITRTILENLGYRVYVARNGEEAVELYRQKSGEIDLVILDIVMPKMNGRRAHI